MAERGARFVMVLLALCAVALPQAEATGERKQRGERVEPLPREEQERSDRARARDRWDAMSERERKLMRERYEKLQQMAPAERKELEQRAERFAKLRERTWEWLSDADRARLEALPTEKRQDVLQEMMVAEARAIGERILDKLPAETRRRIENARPGDRIHYLQEYKHKQLKRLDGMLSDLGQRLNVGRDELRANRSLPVEERKQQVLGWLKDHATAQFELGLDDPDFPTSNLRRLARLEPEEFFAALLRMREKHPGVAEPFGIGRRSEREERVRALRHLMRSPVEEHVELADLEPRARRKEYSKRRRQRVLTHLREQVELPAEELRELSEAPDALFFRKVRELYGAGPRPRLERREHKGRRRGPR